MHFGFVLSPVTYSRPSDDHFLWNIITYLRLDFITYDLLVIRRSIFQNLLIRINNTMMPVK